MTIGFKERVEDHQRLLRKRGAPLAGEHQPPEGQAAFWYGDVIGSVPRSGRQVAKQLARLCRDDSEVVIPWRSLAEAVGVPDKAGRTRAYAERGVASLVESAWLEVETTGRGRGAHTTFRLLPGDRDTHWWVGYDDEDD